MVDEIVSHLMNQDDNSSSSRNNNPLLPLVLRLLREQPAGISEYELLKKIEADGAHFAQMVGDTQLALFQKHFLIMNALYRLQESLWSEERLWLTITPLRIALENIDASENIRTLETLDSATAEKNLAPHGDNALRTYYLDWQQFIATDSAAVTKLLAGFWTRFAAHDRRGEALATLQLDGAADWSAIKKQYRRLAAATHPDRGGDAAQFLAVRAAYETLCLSN